MRCKFLGIICILYSMIITYVFLTDTLKNYLVPKMQIYLIASILPLFMMGILLFFQKSSQKGKVSDAILLLPLIFIFASGDGKLTVSFATNRMIPINKVVQENKNIKNSIEEENREENIEESVKELEEIKRKEEEKEMETNREEEKSNSIEKMNEEIYFDIMDETYNDLSNYLTYEKMAQKYIGKRIRLRGFIIKNPPYVSDNYFAIGKYTISCCVADAGFVGMIAEYDKSKIKDDAWYEVIGTLVNGKDKYDTDIMLIQVESMKEIDSSKEELYVYPCYGYGDGSCSAMKKYDIGFE